MQMIPSILAEDMTGMFKVVLGIIIMIIWGISSLVTAVKKKVKQAEARSMVELTETAKLAPVRPAASARRAVASPMLAPPLPKPAVRRPTVASTPTVATPAAPRREVLPVTFIDASPAARLALKLRPESLKTQWLLTEVLGKPLALRENGDPRHTDTTRKS